MAKWIQLIVLLGSFATLAAGAETPTPRFPNVLVVSIDTLRVDRLSGYGYGRQTSPNLDRLMAQGARFDQARCGEPLTGPSMASIFTSMHPHSHGGTRNGLRIRPGLPSLSQVLGRRGFRTAAFISNWTLKDKLSGLGEHFEDYNEVLTRMRWFGLTNTEATGRDVSEAAIEWLEAHAEKYRSRPFMLWAHYVEPHAPYRFQREFAEQVGLRSGAEPGPSDRYDTEIAFVDAAAGELLQAAERLFGKDQTLVLFVADHGENLGEHGYKGHGRYLWEESLRIPLSITWPGRLKPQVIEQYADTLDVAPTLLGLLGLPAPETFRGYDWAPVLRGEAAPPTDRVTYYQAHRGAVHSPQDTQRVRRRGLLEVGLIDGTGRKEVLRLKNDSIRRHDLNKDPGEKVSLSGPADRPSQQLREWLEEVRAGLKAADDLPPPSLDEESLEQLRALGYLD